MTSPKDLEPRLSNALAQGAARVDPPAPDWDGLVTAARRRRHTRIASAAITAVLVLAVVIGIAASGIGRDSSSIAPATNSRQQSLDRPAPPVPEGWKPVTFDTVQFAVPADWPVYDDGRCNNHEHIGVFLGRNGSGCSGTFSAITVDVLGFLGDGSPTTCAISTPGATSVTICNAFPTATTINGLHAFTREPDGVDGRPDRYTVALPDEDVIIEVSFLASSDRALAAQIVSTIGAAPNPQPVPTPAPAPVPTTKAGPAGFCAAVQAFRLSGATSALGPDSLPYLTQIRDAAPNDLRGPVEVLIAWIEAGSPTPAPAEVTQAQLKTTQDWISRCPPSGQASIQVLNASGTQGAATSRTADFKANGWETRPPANAPALRSGTAVQCADDRTEIYTRDIVSILASLGITATSEPLPKPLPTEYDPLATCWVILGT